MYQLKVEVESNEKVAEDVYKLRINSSQITSSAQPGQFVHLLLNEDRCFILRRPFSIHRVIKDSFEVLFQVVGKGTKYLSTMKPGNFLDVIGPVGKGFEIDKGFKNILLLAGGIGIAPLVFLAESLKEEKKDVYV
ncbi:MAG: FAD-binding oxidoreductase, partial [Candidatus Subteraquimicrobiales bacterium]|nr:FAD-binding oxidoreductase [Candidatus Subteraquimicrobiales bacterium]